MKATILLNYNENTRQVENEERDNFLYSLLEKMGLPIADIWNSGEPLEISQKIKLRELLTTYNVQVIDEADGHMQVFVDRELVGEWNKCTYKLKKDLQQLDRKKQLYLEMTTDCWSVFDEPK